jgi:hypothetical protein
MAAGSPFPMCNGKTGFVREIDTTSMARKTLDQAECAKCHSYLWIDPVTGEPSMSPWEWSQDFDRRCREGYQAAMRANPSSLRGPDDTSMNFVVNARWSNDGSGLRPPDWESLYTPMDARYVHRPEED